MIPLPSPSLYVCIFDVPSPVIPNSQPSAGVMWESSQKGPRDSIDGFPLKSPLYNIGFSIAMFDYQKVYIYIYIRKDLFSLSLSLHRQEQICWYDLFITKSRQGRGQVDKKPTSDVSVSDFPSAAQEICYEHVEVALLIVCGCSGFN